MIFKANSTTNSLVTSLDFISPPVSSERQVHSIYCNLSSTSDLVSLTVLHNRIFAFCLSDAYIIFFCSYLSNWQYTERILDAY